jgi:glycosyltransferase involved in cell wall biosynthesis
MISVVIPLYNKEKAVRATLESVMVQTYTDYELVIVDDGSTDNSIAVCEEYIANLKFETINLKQEKIHLFSKPNGGVSSARNFGVEKSSGEYVAFLDGDDLWEPTYLEEAAKLIQDFSGAAIYGLGLGSMTNGEKHPAVEFVPAGYRGVVSNLWNNPNTMLAWTSSS